MLLLLPKQNEWRHLYFPCHWKEPLKNRVNSNAQKTFEYFKDLLRAILLYKCTLKPNTLVPSSHSPSKVWKEYPTHYLKWLFYSTATRKVSTLLPPPPATPGQGISWNTGPLNGNPTHAGKLAVRPFYRGKSVDVANLSSRETNSAQAVHASPSSPNLIRPQMIHNVVGTRQSIESSKRAFLKVSKRI